MPTKNFLSGKIWDSLLSDDAKDSAPDYKDRSFLDKTQLALGMYAKASPGGVADEKTKRLMKYHGVDGLEPTNKPGTYSFKRKGKNILVSTKD